MVKVKNQEAVFSNKRIFDYIKNHSLKFESCLFYERMNNQPIHPLVDLIEFDGPTWTLEKEMRVKKILSLFPVNSLKRGHCKKISFWGTKWFGKNSTAEEQIVVDSIEEAESFYSLPCGQATFMKYPNPNVYEQRIELYDFPEEIPKIVERIYMSYVVIHEFAHTLQKAAFYWRHYVENVKKSQPDLKKNGYELLIHGHKYDGKDWQIDFLKDALAYDPITEYSAVYKDSDTDGRLHEYMADYIATRIMGITMNSYGNPFQPSFVYSLMQKIDSFLEAAFEDEPVDLV